MGYPVFDMFSHGDRDRWLLEEDAILLGQCHVDAYRASGPGGQKRNKTSSAVRLRHIPSGEMSIAEESRSQHENKARALRRLRLSIALKVREPLSIDWKPPPHYTQFRAMDGGIVISRRNPGYPAVVAVVMDAVVGCSGRIRDAAERLGLRTAQLSKFIISDKRILAAVNHIRHSVGIRPISGA